MARYIQQGKNINYRNNTANPLKYGDVVVLTDRIGVADVDIPVGGLGSVGLEGVFEVDAEGTAAFAVGQTVYWDAANKHVTATKAALGSVLAGIVVEPKASADTMAYVKL